MERVLKGGRTPFLLHERHRRATGAWALVSEAYVYGIMDGAAWDAGMDVRDIILV